MFDSYKKTNKNYYTERKDQDVFRLLTNPEQALNKNL